MFGTNAVEMETPGPTTNRTQFDDPAVRSPVTELPVSELFRLC